MIFNISSDGKKLVVEAAISPGSPGKFYGPPEDCYPSDPGEIEVDSIAIKIGNRKKVIDWNSLQENVQDAILDEIMNQWNESMACYKAEAAESLYDAYSDR